jgi:hypothetical protein
MRALVFEYLHERRRDIFSLIVFEITMNYYPLGQYHQYVSFVPTVFECPRSFVRISLHARATIAQAE